MRNCLAVLFLTSVLSTTCAAQGYAPVGKKPTTEHAVQAFVLSPDSTDCKTEDIPTVLQLKTKKFETRTVVKMGSELAKFNVSWMGNAGGDFNANQLYAVSDTGRMKGCTAKDGKTTVYYGQVIRTVIAMNDYKVDANANIAVIAASATVSGKTNSVDIYEIGYGDSALDTKILAAKHTVNSGLTIENYQDYLKAFGDAETAAVAVTNPGIDIVGYDVPYTAEDVSASVAVTFALKYIRDGKGCGDAVKDFKSNDDKYKDAINGTYTTIAGGCGVDATGKANASKILNGLKITY